MKLYSAFASMVLMGASLSLMAKTVQSTSQEEEDDYQDDVLIPPHTHPRAGKMNACLQNCAYCVQFWEHGLYNGRRCAKRCLHRRGRVVVDPDCNDPKMFNYSPRIISDLLMEMRENQADQPASNNENDDDEGDRVRSRPERSGEVDRRSKRKPLQRDTSERYKRKVEDRRKKMAPYELNGVGRSDAENGHKRQFRGRSQRPQS